DPGLVRCDGCRDGSSRVMSKALGPNPGRGASHASAARELAAREPVLAALVDAVGPPRLRRPLDTHFAALVRSITYQQLAGPAAAAIHGRLVAALGGEVTPDRLLALSAEALRSAGMSPNKAASVRDL